VMGGVLSNSCSFSRSIKGTSNAFLALIF
jgi:hypothetical protein